MQTLLIRELILLSSSGRKFANKIDKEDAHVCVYIPRDNRCLSVPDGLIHIHLLAHIPSRGELLQILSPFISSGKAYNRTGELSEQSM